VLADLEVILTITQLILLDIWFIDMVLITRLLTSSNKIHLFKDIIALIKNTLKYYKILSAKSII